MDVLHLELPWPPSGNHRNGKRNNRYYNTKAYRTFIDGVALCVLEQAKDWEKTKDRVEMDVYFAPPDRRKRDADNFLKTLMDAITKSGGVWEDDYNVRPISMDWCPPHPGGKVDVYITAKPWRTHTDTKGKRPKVTKF